MSGAGTALSETSLRWPKWFARLAAGTVFLLGGVATLGWAFDLAILKSGLPGLPPMVPNTAACFMLAGFSLWLLVFTPVTQPRAGVAKTAAVIVGLVGALTLGETIWDWRIPIDHLLFPAKTLALGGAIPGRPSLLTAGAFLLYGLALLLLDIKPRAKIWPFDLFIVVPVLVSLLALIGYACGVPSFYGWRSLFPNTVMAMPTAVAVIILGLGILSSRVNRNLMKLLTSSTAGGQVARRLLLAPVLIPLLIGLIKIVNQRLGFYNAEFWGWLFAFLDLLTFTLMIWWIAELAHQTDVVRQQAEDQVRQLNAELETRVVSRTAELENTAKNLASEVLERKQVEVKVTANLARLELLHQITRSIGQRQDLKSIFQVVLRRLEDRLPIEFGCICLYDPAAESLTVTCVGPKSELLAVELEMPENSTVQIDENGLGSSLHGNLVYEPDTSEVDFPFPGRLAQGGLRSLVIAPLLVESNVFGVLIAARRAPQSFSSGDCEFLRQLSEHAALAANQAQLYTALQRAYDDLRQSQQAMMQQERLRALGEMASGIAHDINNALSPAALYTESLLETEKTLSPRAREQLQIIERAIGDVAQTVARMRDFYRQREPQLVLAPVDLNLLVPQVIDLTRARWSDMSRHSGLTIETRIELAPDLPNVLGVESEIREALINLILNAVDAMPNGGQITIQSYSSGDPGTSPINGNFEQVIIEVTDSGIGMNEETKRRCLEPFFTTKGERGTGLGLAMVYGVAQRHNADLEIDSAPEKGTTVRLIFPARGSGASAPTETSALPVLARQRVLIIDDDPVLLKSLRDILENDGHVVVAANDGREGLHTFSQAHHRRQPFDIVITDLGMPHIDGRKVASAIKSTSPGTPVILLTGWGRRLIAEQDIPPHVDRVLSKPPKLRELRQAFGYCAQLKSPDKHLE